MSERLTTITVLDFMKGKVYQYDIDKWGIDEQRIEDFLHEIGHDVSNCQWMVHEDSTIYIENYE